MVDTGLNINEQQRSSLFREQKPFTTFGQDKQYIRTIERETGKKISDITSKCNHGYCPIIEHPVDPEFILEVCTGCEVIRSCNINTAESKTGCKPYQI